MVNKIISNYMKALGVKGRKSRWGKMTRKQRVEYMRILGLKRKIKEKAGRELNWG